MRILIPVLVGSLIGYLTNWLAIKMLFKPHYEKKIFGITLPFTPGLIPKEKENIAKNIGNAVGTHLLSTDTIIEAISNSENEKKIRSWLNEKIEKLRQEKMTVNQYLSYKLGEEYKVSNRDIDAKISNYIIRFVRSEKFKSSLAQFIDENIDKYDTSSLYGDIEIKAKYLIDKLLDSDDLICELEEIIFKILEDASESEETIENLISNQVFYSIDVYLDEHQDEIGDSIRDILKDREIKAKIKNSIADIVFDRSNKVLMAFIGPEIISEKIFESIEKYIEKEETNEDIVEAIKFLLEKAKASKVSNIAINMRKILAQISLEPVLTNIIDNIFKDENVDKSINELLNLLRENESENKDTIKKFIGNEIEKIISSDYIEVKTNQIVENITNTIGDKSISDLFKGLNDGAISKAYNFSKKIFNQFAKYELPRIIEMLNVSKIVEDKINSFEIDYTEKLILDIAKRELNQITRLGALLGGILGLLSPLLQYIY